MHEFNEDRMLATLQQLPPRGGSAFAVACASRLAQLDLPPLPEVVVALCTRAASLAEVFVASGQLDLAEAEALSTDLEASSDVDDDRVASFAFVVRHLLSNQPQDVLWAARRAYECCDAIALREIRSLALDRIDERAVLAHPTVQAELARQAHHLAQLASAERAHATSA
jgi:hypothetical protein